MNDNTKKQRPLRIFFSYAAADRAYAARVQNILSQRPEAQIFTMESLSAGEGWQAKLKQELSSSDIFMVLLSPNSLTARWVLEELGAALGIEKPIIPIVTTPEIIFKIPVSLKKYFTINDLEQPGAIAEIFDQYPVLRDVN